MRTHASTVRNLIAALDAGGVTELPSNIDERDDSGLSLAQTALAKQHPGALRFLLERGAYLEPEHQLAAAIVCGDLDRVSSSLEGVDLERPDRFDRTPLMYAVSARSLAIIDLLLARGATSDVPNVWGGNILHLAAWDADPAVIELLIRGGADVNRLNDDGESPLLRLLGPWRGSFSAAEVESARLLVEGGASLHYAPAVPGRNGCALLKVVNAFQPFSEGHVTMLSLLLAAGGQTLIRTRGAPALLEATRGGHLVAVEALLDAGASPDGADEHGGSPVALAIRFEHAEVLAALLRRGARVPAQDEEGRSLVRQAKAARDPRIAELIAPYRSQADDPPSSAGLADAITADDLTAVNRLLDDGVDPNAAFAGEETPLVLAARLGRPAILRALATRGASVNAPPRGRWPSLQPTPLLAAVECRQLECIRVLIALGSDPNASTHDVNPIWRAADRGDQESMRLLLDAGGDPYLRGPKGYTPLARAAKHAHFSTMDLLCSAMHDRKRRRRHLRFALRAAVYEQLLEVVRYIVEGYPEVADGPDALAEAVEGAATRGNAEILRYLLSRGPCSLEGSPRSPNDLDDSTPLMLAVLTGDLETVRVLVRAGANLQTKERRLGYTPLMFACYQTLPGCEHPQIIHFLVEESAELDARAKDGRTALMIAVQSGCYGAVEALMAHRPDLSVCDQKGRTAIDLARLGSRPEILGLLRTARDGRPSPIVPATSRWNR